MNEHYSKAAVVVSTLNKGGEGLWKHLVLFAVDMSKKEANPADNGEKMKLEFKQAELYASRELKADMAKNSTYRVAKGVLVAAVEANIPLLDKDGKPRGKTDVENQLKEMKEEKVKSPLEKFQAAMLVAVKQIPKLSDSDVTVATAEAKSLYAQLGALLLALPNAGS